MKTAAKGTRAQKSRDRKTTKRAGNIIEYVLHSEVLTRIVDGIASLYEGLLWRRYNSVLVDWRNQMAVGIIEEWICKLLLSKVLVHYGEAHIRGMTKLLRQSGFAVIRTEKIVF